MSIVLRSAAALAWLALSACTTPSPNEVTETATDTSSITDRTLFEELMANLLMYRTLGGDNIDRVDVHIGSFGYGSIAISATHESFYVEKKLVERAMLYVSMRLNKNYQYETLTNGNKWTTTTEMFEARISKQEFEELIAHLDRNDFYSLPDSNVSDENAPMRDGVKLYCLDGGGYMLNLQAREHHRFISRNSCYSKYSDASSYAAPLFGLARKRFPEIAGRLSEIESMLDAES